MPTFTVGEEVLYEDERFVIAAIEPGRARYRLLATTAAGARVVWAPHAKLQKMTRYTLPKDDTLRLSRKP